MIKFKDILTVYKNVDDGQANNCLVRLQFRHNAYFLGYNPKGYGVHIYLFAPTKTNDDEYKCVRFGVIAKWFRVGAKKSK